jgi:methanol--5-hydroxybenzimidazolylcobamide Co-methyltransferase
LKQVIFALAVLGVKDMGFLWDHIVRIAGENGTYAAGDTACGFGNTAMVLAEKHHIPRVFAAVVRSVSAVRSLVAYEKGAVGPGKDCGYENVFLKAITGYPISMEGKSAACAHLSPIGNIASAMCDLWSNESVQNIKLLGGMAPIVSLEQLAYDCRLMNRATETTHAHTLRDLLTGSDAAGDPQAFILTPQNVVQIARCLVESENAYRAAVQAALTTIRILREGLASGGVRIDDREKPYLDMMEDALSTMPAQEDLFTGQMLSTLNPSLIIPSEYGL